MQPRRPHGQRAPLRRTTTWPISPAAASPEHRLAGGAEPPPRPSHGLPSSTSPPPTPVPQNTPRIDRYSLPAPSSNSALVATWTSLPTATGAPHASDSASASG